MRLGELARDVGVAVLVEIGHGTALGLEPLRDHLFLEGHLGRAAQEDPKRLAYVVGAVALATGEVWLGTSHGAKRGLFRCDGAECSKGR